LRENIITQEFIDDSYKPIDRFELMDM